MGIASSFVPQALALAVAAMAAVTASPVSAQQEGECGLGAALGAEHAGETPIFTGNDYTNNVFTLTQNRTTGAWALWVISEFEKSSGGLEVGKPCIIAAGRDSKLLDGGALEAALAGDGSLATAGEGQAGAAVEAPVDATAEVATAETDAETYSVIGLAADAVLDLRTGPGTDFESIAQIPPDGAGVTIGSCKKVKGYKFNWCEASWQGYQGWASACCLVSDRTGKTLD